MRNCECATPQKFFDSRFLAFSRELSAPYLGLRPDCEGFPHPLRFRTGQVFPSSVELTDAFEGTQGLR
jgi:hypothetical protein